MSFPTRPNIFQSTETHAHMQTNAHTQFHYFCYTILYLYNARKVNESGWYKCHLVSHAVGAVRRAHTACWTRKHAPKLPNMKMNYNERAKGNWKLLNQLKSQRFFNKSSPKANFCPLGLALWIARYTCLQCMLVQGLHTLYINQEVWIS